jgi:hypothetical protein
VVDFCAIIQLQYCVKLPPENTTLKLNYSSKTTARKHNIEAEKYLTKKKTRKHNTESKL